jgi:integrase
MGWAEKLPSGRYRAVYRDAAGTRRSAGTFSHKPAAVRAANAAEDDARRTMAKDPEGYRRPWGEWCDEWWPTRHVEASTLRNDASRRRNHLDPRWADVPIGSITRQDVRAWAAQLRAGGLGVETVKRCVHLLSASLGAAVDAEVIATNPAARLKLGGGTHEQERYLTREEYGALWDAMPTTEDRLIFETLCHTGLRWAELAGLHRSRVDLGRGVVRVVETYDELAGRIKAYPKGKTARDVPLTPSLVAAYRALPAAAGECDVVHQVGRCPSPLLLTSSEGRPLRNSNWATKVWRPAVERAGIGHVRIHDCRHTYASWLLQAGVPLAEVGRLLGHRSTATTARYAHLAETPTAAVLAALVPHESPTASADQPGNPAGAPSSIGRAEDF